MDTKKFHGKHDALAQKNHFHEIFSCPFVHFVVQKEILAYPSY